jgi:hypothetical protein
MDQDKPFPRNACLKLPSMEKRTKTSRMNMQKQKEDALLERLKELMQHVGISPVTQEELIEAEAQLGFELPSFVRRLYYEVGNGGFGGMFPLNGQRQRRFSWSAPLDTIVTAYLEMRSRSQEDSDQSWTDEEKRPKRWPERVLMICDWGCNIYSCLDCSSPNLPVLRMDSNRNIMVEWAIEASSLWQWLEAWLDEEDLFHVDWKHATKIPVSRLGIAGK